MPSAGALLSDCGRYRYRLWRDLSVLPPAAGRVCFVMVNPSTADARKSDPTTDKCIAFATRWGFAHLDLVNLFAWRSPRVEDLLAVADPVGERADAELRVAVAEASRVVLAWGAHRRVAALIAPRARQVLDIVTGAARAYHHSGHPLEIGALGWNADGSPKHPLYLSAETPFQGVDLSTIRSRGAVA
jgi:hypothetical protein